MNENENKSYGSIEEIISANEDGSLSVPEEVVSEGSSAGDSATSPENTSDGVVDANNATTTDTQSENAERQTSPAESYEQVMGVASEHDENAQLREEVRTLREQLAASQAQAQANANAAQQNVAEHLSDDALPVLDIDACLYANEEDRARMMSDFTQKIISHTEQNLLKKLAPVVEHYDREHEAAVFDESINRLAQHEDFAEIGALNEDIRRISAMDELKSIPVNKRTAIAALIAKGLNVPKPVPPAPAPDINTQADEIFANPELMKALEARRVNAIRENGHSIPVHKADGNLSSAAYFTPDKPKTIEELKAQHGVY